MNRNSNITCPDEILGQMILSYAGRINGTYLKQAFIRLPERITPRGNSIGQRSRLMKWWSLVRISHSLGANYFIKKIPERVKHIIFTQSSQLDSTNMTNKCYLQGYNEVACDYWWLNFKTAWIS